MSGFEAARTANELPGVKKAERRGEEKLHKFDFFIMTTDQPPPPRKSRKEERRGNPTSGSFLPSFLLYRGPNLFHFCTVDRRYVKKGYCGAEREGRGGEVGGEGGRERGKLPQLTRLQSVILFLITPQ